MIAMKRVRKKAAVNCILYIVDSRKQMVYFVFRTEEAEAEEETKHIGH